MVLLFPMFGRLMDRYGVRKFFVPGTLLLTLAFSVRSMQTGSILFSIQFARSSA